MSFKRKSAAEQIKKITESETMDSPAIVFDTVIHPAPVETPEQAEQPEALAPELQAEPEAPAAATEESSQVETAAIDTDRVVPRSGLSDVKSKVMN